MPPWLAGLRLDQGLARLTKVSRRRVRALIEAGQVSLDSRPTRTLSRPLLTGQVIDLLTPLEGAAPSDPLPQVEILFQDAWLAAVAKPSGMPATAPRIRAPQEITAGEALTLLLSARAGRRVEVIVLHRLDRPTSGLMLFALHPRATGGLARAWRLGQVNKGYLALVAGNPGHCPVTLDQPLARDPLSPGRFVPSPRGRVARTVVHTLAAGPAASLIEARPLTGRSHQIRVHLAAAGWPVLGDRLYGGGSAPRLMLHAWRLELDHPVTGSPLLLTAPIPEDFTRFVHLSGLGEALASLPQTACPP